MNGLLEVRVARKRVEAQDICSFELVDATGGDLPAFSAGSHVDVHVPGGLVRQYSLCNDPRETHRYQIGVLRDAATRGGSKAMHEQVHEGDVLTIGRPRNQFGLAPDAQRSLLLAGGIGITPILSMAEELARCGAEFDLHYCTRSPARTAFRDRIATSAFAERVHCHFDDAARKISLPALLRQPQPGLHLYVCGPKGFMDAVLGTARAHDWPAERLHHEHFAAGMATPADGAFEVELARSGRVVRVPANVTVARALRNAGIDVPLSCEQGLCGTCLTPVLEGEVDHRDLFLSPDAQARHDCFTPCCSRAKSARLVIDV